MKDLTLAAFGTATPIIDGKSEQPTFFNNSY